MPFLCKGNYRFSANYPELKIDFIYFNYNNNKFNKMKRPNDEISTQFSKKRKCQYQITVDEDIFAVMSCLKKWDKSHKHLKNVPLKDFLEVYSEFYDLENNINNLINFLDLELKDVNETIKKINTIADKLEEVYPKKTKNIQKAWTTSKVEYKDILSYFPLGTNFVLYSKDEPICVTIVDKNVENGFFENTEIMWCCFKYSTSSHTYEKMYSTLVFGPSKRPLDFSKYKKLDPKMKDRLEKRGEVFDKYTRGIHHLNLKGPFYAHSHKYMLNGRVIIDQYFNKNDEVNNFIKNVPSYQIYPFLAVYDLSRHHMWGECSPEYLSEIEYNDDCFDMLKISNSINYNNSDMEVKDVIKNLISNKEKVDFRDIVYGKNTGMVFLLHGPSGVGKTLLAQVTAETLHMPLYYLTAGDLGESVVSVENSLKNKLDLVKRWNAVMLIDEADVYLEKRVDNSNIQRNAIVSVFLRLLESHDGIVFLTSNRMESIDDAFISRISLIVPFKDLDVDDRVEIWKSQIQQSQMNIHKDGILILAEYNLNGRQIKNIIKLAQCSDTDEKFAHIVSLCKYFLKNHQFNN